MEIDLELGSPAALVYRTLRRLQQLPVSPVEDFTAAFSQKYRQSVDGHELDFAAFTEHLAALRNVLQTLDINILAIASNGNEVLTHHRAIARKNNGAISHTEVYAHFTVENNLITRCQELTRLISGDEEDRDLGSRR